MVWRRREFTYHTPPKGCPAIHPVHRAALRRVDCRNPPVPHDAAACVMTRQRIDLGVSLGVAFHSARHDGPCHAVGFIESRATSANETPRNRSILQCPRKPRPRREPWWGRGPWACGTSTGGDDDDDEAADLFPDATRRTRQGRSDLLPSPRSVHVVRRPTPPISRMPRDFDRCRPARPYADGPCSSSAAGPLRSLPLRLGGASGGGVHPTSERAAVR